VEVVAAGQRRVDEARADQRDVDVLGGQVQAQRFEQVAQAGLGCAIGAGARQRQPGHRTADAHQQRALTTAQQRQRRLDAVARRDQIGAQHAFEQFGSEMPGVDVLAGAGIEDQRIQRAPACVDLRGNGAHLRRVGQVARQHQHLLGVLPGKGMQRLGTARRQCQPVAFGEQLTRQSVADAAAGAGQPDTPNGVHASLRCSQRIAVPSSGTC